MEKATSTQTKHNGLFMKKGGKEVGDVSEALESLSNYALQGAGDWLQKVSKHLPAATAHFVRKHWRPVAISTGAAIVVGVTTYFIALRYLPHSRRLSILN